MKSRWILPIQMTNVAVAVTLLVLVILQTRIIHDLVEPFRLASGNAGNDIGQRGLAFSWLLVLIVVALLSGSSVGMQHRRAQGFLVHSIAWLLIFVLCSTRLVPVAAVGNPFELLDTVRYLFLVPCALGLYLFAVSRHRNPIERSLSD